tara:strand:- start:434 stop:553 length:120 start_codon:yes stop_codon:yes gene_type:complete
MTKYYEVEDRQEEHEDREGYLLSQREKEQEEMKDNVYPT